MGPRLCSIVEDCEQQGHGWFQSVELTFGESAEVNPPKQAPGGDMINFDYQLSDNQPTLMFNGGSALVETFTHVNESQMLRQSSEWRDWLRKAAAGRSVTIMAPKGESKDGLSTVWERAPATFYISHNPTRIIFAPLDCTQSVSISVNNVQLICLATAVMPIFNEIKPLIADDEKGRAVLVQYSQDRSENSPHRHVIFINDHTNSRDRFIPILVGLWLEKRGLGDWTC